MSIQISELRAHDAEAAAPLWSQINEPADNVPAAIVKHLAKNSGLSLVARDGDAVVGLIVCSRRGDLGCVNRLKVADSHKDQGVAKMLVDKALLKMASHGIHKCGIDVVDEAARQPFWEAVRWAAQTDNRVSSDAA
ncbi:MAG: GNAT family N-acetyltransferase [Planctomycetes bacterium]|nr:GNAT family N-acetyltransferase [Planctomycetota bacterium]